MSELEGLRIGFIGCGAMAQALAGGLLAAGVRADHVLGCDPSAQARARFEALGARVPGDNDALVSASDVVVLAVKPGVVAQALADLRDDRDRGSGPLWISIAAGIPLARLAAPLPAGARIVRAMPNTPALVRAGATGLARNEATTDADLAVARALFESVGEVWEAPEEALIDAVTGLSGSGPAYLFLLLEALCAAGEQVGLPRDAAAKLALQTTFGAAKLALESADDPAALRERVSSPGGTTLAGLAELEAGGFRQLVANAVRAATARSRELSSET